MTRRHLLLGSLTAAAAYAGDPWKKKYTAWTRDDAQAIWAKSPWALTTKVDFKIQGKDLEGPRSGGVIGPMEGPPGGNGTIGPPGGAPARSGGGIKQIGPGDMPTFHTLVRWESALPMRLAQGKEASLKPDHYVISVSGFPILRADIAASIPAFKGTTRLERYRKEWLRPVRIEVRDTVLVFTFDGTADPITADDRDVFFITSLGAMNVRAKFSLKDMLFDKKLEL